VKKGTQKVLRITAGDGYIQVSDLRGADDSALDTDCSCAGPKLDSVEHDIRVEAIDGAVSPGPDGCGRATTHREVRNFGCCVGFDRRHCAMEATSGGECSADTVDACEIGVREGKSTGHWGASQIARKNWTEIAIGLNVTDRFRIQHVEGVAHGLPLAKITNDQLADGK